MRKTCKRKGSSINRKIRSVLAAALALLVLCGAVAGCGSQAKKSGEEGEPVRLIIWSPSEDQSRQKGAWLQTCCEKFDDMHPEWDITFVYDIVDESTAASVVVQDPEASADIFLFSNDSISKLADAQAITRFGGKYEEMIRADNDEVILNSVSLDGSLYGIPFTSNTWFMYYDKRVFSEKDVRSLDTMLKKGVVSFPLTTPWYTSAFYLGNGCTLFGDGTQAEKGVDFGGEKAAEVTDYLIDLMKNDHFVVDANGSGISGMRHGSVNAVFSGSWDYSSVREILGDHLGAAALPTYTLKGEKKQMYAFAGSKAIGVNSNCKNMVPAVELAIYLGSSEAQKLHYNLRSVIPCSTTLLTDPSISSDPVTAAQNETVSRTSIMQPYLNEMGDFWKPVENLGLLIQSRKVTHKNAASYTESMNKAINTKGIN